MFLFVWDGKSDGIKRDVLIGDYQNGGFRMPELASQNAAIKMSWLLKGQDQGGMWIEYFINTLPMHDLAYFLRGNLKYVDLPNKPNPNSIWSEIVIQWCLNNQRQPSQNRADIMNENLWWNSAIKIDGKVIYYKTWAQAGVRYIQDLLDENGHLMSHTHFTRKVNLTIPFTTYTGIISALPRDWARQLKMPITEIPEATTRLADKLEGKPKASRKLYNLIIAQKSQKPTTIVERWEKELNCTLPHNQWLKGLVNARYHSISGKIKSWVYKFFLRNVPYNVRLHKMGIAQEDTCKWCPDEAETLIHLYWLCPKSVTLWKHVQALLGQLYNTECIINKEIIFFGIQYTPKSKLTGVLILLSTLTKYFIHCSKCKGVNPSVAGWENLIKKTMAIEESVAKQNSTHGKYLDKWDRLAQTDVNG